MNQKLFIFGILSILIISFGCSSNKNRKAFLNIENYSKNTIEKYPLAFLYQTDTLSLTARFCECGEFGGHKEKIKIFNNYKNECFVRFIKDSIDLECPNDFDKNAVIIIDTIFKIDKPKQIQIVKYLNSLYKKSVANYSLDHAAEYFDASTTQNRLKLYTAEPENKWKEFRKLQRNLIK